VEIPTPQVTQLRCSQSGVDRHDEQREQGGGTALPDGVNQLDLILAANRSSDISAFGLELDRTTLGERIPESMAFEDLA
jgi:hypothetical protein